MALEKGASFEQEDGNYLRTGAKSKFEIAIIVKLRSLWGRNH